MKPMINRKLLPNPDTLGTTLLSPPTTYSPDHPLLNASTNSPRTTSFRSNSPLDSSVAITALVLLTALFFSLYLRLFGDSSSSSSRRRHSPSSSTSSSSLPLWRRSSNYPNGLDTCTVRSLPLVSYGGAAKHPIDCVICLCEFEEGETVKMIPHCRHVFHPDCIDTWLGSHVSCPLCRSSRIFGGGGEMCLGVTRVEVEVDPGGGESLGRSTVEIEEEGGMEVGPAGRVRRACSYPILGEVDDHGRSGSLERSTVEIEEVGPAGMLRGASSYPSTGDRGVLKRSLSFEP